MGSPEPPIHLTAAQRAVLELIAQGLTTSEIARKIHRSARTVESHRYQLGKKLGARNQIELLLIARQRGLLSDDPASLPLGTAWDPGAGSATGEQWAAAMLRAVDACLSTGVGCHGVEAGVAHLAHALDAQATMFAKLEPPGVYRVIACRSSTGSLLDLQWSPSEGDWHRLIPGQVVTRTAEELPPTLAQRFRERIGTFERWTGTVAFHNDRELGLLGVLHGPPLDPRRMPDTVIRSIAAKISADVLMHDVQSTSRALAETIRQVEASRRAGTLRVDQVSGLLSISPVGADMLGLEVTRDEWIPTERLLDRLHPDDRSRVQEAIETARRDAIELAIGFRLRDEANRRIELRARSTPGARTGRGELVGIVFGEPQTQAVSTDARAVIQTIVARCPNPTVLVDSNAEVIAANPAWRDRVAGLRTPLNYAEAAREMLDEPSLQRVEAVLWSAASTAGDASTVHRIESAYRAGGSTTVDIYPLPAYAMAIVVHRDPPLAEASQFQRASVNLGVPPSPSDLERAMHWMFDRSPDLICLIDTDGHIRRANPAFCKFVASTEEELASTGYMRFFEEPDRATMQRLIVRLSAGLSVDRVVLPIRCADSEVRYAEWSCAPPHPGAILLMPIGRDVTSEVRASMLLPTLRQGLSRYLQPAQSERLSGDDDPTPPPHGQPASQSAT